MKRAIGFIIVALLLMSCATGVTPTEVPIDTTVSGDVGEISNSVESSVKNITQQMTWWQFVLVILLAGWAIPSPGEMFRGMFSGLIALKGLFFGR